VCVCVNGFVELAYVCVLLCVSVLVCVFVCVPGLILSMLYAYYTFVKYAKLWELQRKV